MTDPAAISSQLNNVVIDVTKLFESLANQLAKLGSTLQNLATAGLAATTEGNKLSYAWTLLSRQIASIFLPVLDLVIAGILKLTEWFRSLTGEGQSIAMSISLVAVGLKLLAPALSFLKGLFSPIALVIGLVVEAMTEFFTGTAEGQVLLAGISDVVAIFTTIFAAFGDVFKVVIDAIVVAFQWLYRSFVWVSIKIAEVIEAILDWIPGMGDAVKSIQEWRQNAQANLDAMLNKGDGANAKVTKDKPRREVNPAGFAFESLAASFERITAEANKRDLAKESLDTQKAQLAEQKKTNEMLAKNGWSPEGSTGKDYLD